LAGGLRELAGVEEIAAVHFNAWRAVVGKVSSRLSA
jgi:hypothetical protein